MESNVTQYRYGNSMKNESLFCVYHTKSTIQPDHYQFIVMSHNNDEWWGGKKFKSLILRKGREWKNLNNILNK